MSEVNADSRTGAIQSSGASGSAIVVKNSNPAAVADAVNNTPFAGGGGAGPWSVWDDSSRCWVRSARLGY
jgi:hypothetical protein